MSDTKPMSEEWEWLLQLQVEGLGNEYDQKAVKWAITEIRRLRAELEAICKAAIGVALKRPHDGSQLDEDLEGLLLAARKS